MSYPFRNELSEFVFYRTYARWLDREKRRETWDEVTERYFNNVINKHKDTVPRKIQAEIKDNIFKMASMPSMRGLWCAGPALDISNVCLFNCSYLPIKDLFSFAEMLYILCCGTGVGFSVEEENITQLPEIQRQTSAGAGIHEVEDSKEGWADSLMAGLETWFSGKDIEFNYDKIRPRGARLITFGGRASGPEPLKRLHEFSKKIILEAQGRKLTSLECHDICCKIAEIVVVGGVRRSSLASFSDLNDELLMKAKNPPFPSHRYMSNNSAVYTKKPDSVTFMREWYNLAASGTGERGIYNIPNLSNYAPRRIFTGKERSNPCFEIILKPFEFCVAGDTPLIHKTGILNIKNAVNKPIEIWNGEKWSLVTVRRTRRDQKLVRVTLTDGSYLDCTPDHRFSVKTRFMKYFKEVPASRLLNSDYSLQCENFSIDNIGGIRAEDAYDIGFSVGDGFIQKNMVYANLYGEKDKKCPIKGIRYKEYLPKGYSVSKIRIKTGLDATLISSLKTDSNASDILFTWDRPSVLKFIAGLADADGSETKTGGIRIYISDEKRVRKFQLLLTKNGIRSSVNLLQKKGTRTNLSVRKKDLWYLQITECNEIPCFRLDTSGGHKTKYKGKYQNIKSVVLLRGLHDTYCFNEPEKHKGVFSNVLTYQCNLSDVVVRASDSFDDLVDKVRAATWICAIQSTFTNFKYIRSEWKSNCDEERLLGVSLTGQLDNPKLLSEEKLQILKEYSIKTAKKAAEALKINLSAAITTTKPSGTVSQLVDSASGCHPRYSKFYTRRVRISDTDPLFKMMRAQGVKFEPEVDQDPKNPDTWVVSFPVKSPKNSITRDEMTAIEQLNWYRKLQNNWSEHNNSVTIYVKENEWPEVGSYVYKHFDEIVGVSFLPYDGGKYKLAPYEMITEEEYNKNKEKFPKINYSDLYKYEEEDNTEGAKSYACIGDRCEI